jgi:hypothetical protein
VIQELDVLPVKRYRALPVHRNMRRFQRGFTKIHGVHVARPGAIELLAQHGTGLAQVKDIQGLDFAYLATIA